MERANTEEIRRRSMESTTHGAAHVTTSGKPRGRTQKCDKSKERTRSQSRNPKKDIYSIRKFDGTNFPVWKEQIQDVLIQKGQLQPLHEREEGIIDAEWKMLDAKARSTLFPYTTLFRSLQKICQSLLCTMAIWYQKTE